MTLTDPDPWAIYEGRTVECPSGHVSPELPDPDAAIDWQEAHKCARQSGSNERAAA